MWGFLLVSFLVFSVYKNLRPNHILLFLGILPDPEMIVLLSKCLACKLYFYFSMSQILNRIYIWVLLVNNESALLFYF